MSIQSNASSSNPKKRLIIARNKHWRYISSFHGPWLQLPIELLESLFAMNADASSHLTSASIMDSLQDYTKSSIDNRFTPPTKFKEHVKSLTGSNGTGIVNQQSLSTPFNTDTIRLPPIDPTVFRSVIEIRKLVDEASDLAVRALSGAPPGDPDAVRQPCTMSKIRQHRMRELAVNKLAHAYMIDEVATAVLVMQSTSAIDEVAAHVLKRSPNSFEALYVNFFHEKIPSRMLAQYTTTDILDKMIAESPSRPAYYRTRGIVNAFKDEYSTAIKDLNTGLSHIKHYKRMHMRSAKSGGLHNSMQYNVVEYSAIECQLYFLRGAFYAEYALSVLNNYMKSILEVSKTRKKKNKKKKKKSVSGTETQDKLKDDMEESNRDFSDNTNQFCERTDFQGPDERRLFSTIDQVAHLSRKAIRDLSHFLLFYTNNVNANNITTVATVSSLKVNDSEGDKDPIPELIATYHPLLTEAYYLMLLCHSIQFRPPNMTSTPLLETDTEVKFPNMDEGLEQKTVSRRTNHEIFNDIMKLFALVQRIHDATEAYPIFMPARSMAQADFLKLFGRQSTLTTELHEDNETHDMILSLITFVSSFMKENEGVSEPENISKEKLLSTRQYPLYTPRAETLANWLRLILDIRKEEI